ncbi:type I-E CRISPR-associated protein Cse1/CasA [Deinococcus sp. MIMF12]|uniref:Type I-E CRISPR-associated protein Cse1/CasA n=1 Tax=Deinococcus rhizophilus TaxID=3049544 RepID=A0ABT7JG81_9DEIO|nr:type I-E CRISPR-associated protein Cse1/CasA [Deinococcus rhizophilus]MDL2344050.1 type I-E CRISPR-associated protein Cse1/CasA [Deinococcus rhizophilus]
MDTFSLLDRDWIPIVARGSQRRLISLRESLLNGAAYGRIDAGQPLQTAALYRLHLAVLHRALRGPKDEEQAAEWYQHGFPADKVQAYLDQYVDRFHLFGPQPFMQVAGLDPAVEGENFRSHWTRLSTEEGSPNTTVLFGLNKRAEKTKKEPTWESLTPQQAALRLLEVQTSALGGTIQRFTTSADAAPVATLALFLAEGDTLHRTLCLNLVPYAGDAADAPPWERPPLTVADIRALYGSKQKVARVPPGPVSRYVWLSRSVLLLPEETPEGIVVHTVGFGAGEPFEGPGEGIEGNIDPMVTLRTGEQRFPYKLRRDRLLWRDFNALFPDPAATVVIPEKKKGLVKLLPGQAPAVLKHARDVLQKVRAKEIAPPEDDLLMSQDAYSGELASAAESRPSSLGVQPVVPVVVFGQLTKEMKAFAIRQENYTLPETFIENPERFREHVRAALGDAVVVGTGLQESLRRLFTVLVVGDLKKKVNKEVGAKINDMAAKVAAEPTYWAGLDTPFRAYLLALDADPKVALADWHAALSRAARAGWRTAEQAAGMNAVGLRAVEKAQGPWLKALGTLKNGGTP